MYDLALGMLVQVILLGYVFVKLDVAIWCTSLQHIPATFQWNLRTNFIFQNYGGISAHMINE